MQINNNNRSHHPQEEPTTFPREHTSLSLKGNNDINAPSRKQRRAGGETGRWSGGAGGPRGAAPVYSATETPRTSAHPPTSQPPGKVRETRRRNFPATQEPSAPNPSSAVSQSPSPCSVWPPKHLVGRRETFGLGYAGTGQFPRRGGVGGCPNAPLHSSKQTGAAGDCRSARGLLNFFARGATPSPAPEEKRRRDTALSALPLRPIALLKQTPPGCLRWIKCRSPAHTHTPPTPPRAAASVCGRRLGEA